MKKKIDEKIRKLIENAAIFRHRCMFIIIGDRGRDQIVNLHYLMSTASVRKKPSILWCYKKELGFSSHKMKRMKQIKKLQSKGLYDGDVDDPFELFITTTDIKYWYYKETHTVLGNTYGMLVLQDFESITPNVMCRTMETIEGGGIIVLLLNTMTSLRQFYTISMDCHKRYRTENHKHVKPRFNERFMLSIKNCETCLVIDDELNILPISGKFYFYHNVSHYYIDPAKIKEEVDPETIFETKEQKELNELKESLKDTGPIYHLVNLCKTLDQARSVMAMVDTVSQKSASTTTSLTASRGRGKSATLGLVIASSIVYGYSNVFITAPSPENLKTLFEFIFEGLKALNYKEHTDYEIFQSTNPDFKNCIVKISLYRDHRQNIQYIHPQEFNKLLQPEILVIDEAAAIPLPIVRHMMKYSACQTFMSSTVNGYEGTGRSLSLKLISQLRDQNKLKIGEHTAKTGMKSIRDLNEITMDEPIRYGINDPIEQWLHDLLCLDCTEAQPLESGAPHPDLCDLYYVNRDTLFSYHKGSEKFLRKLMSLFVSSHYKNTPNDLQLLSDAPAHGLFVLIGPLDCQKSKIPDILCAIQVWYEGNISKDTLDNSSVRGFRPSGDLIPWTVSEQFQDDNFAVLNGVRIVRIATHPNVQKKGYGTKALRLLHDYYDGLMIDLDNIKTDEIDEFYTKDVEMDTEEHKEGLLKEKIKQRKGLKPIMQKLSERKPISVQYLGTSFGITPELYTFWAKNTYTPLYIRQTPNDLTGEHTWIMIRPIKKDEIKLGNMVDFEEEKVENYDGWAYPYTSDFRIRFMSLLGFEFSKLPWTLALSILLPTLKSHVQADQLIPDYNKLDKVLLKREITVFDLKRLESYSKNLIDFHLVIDLVPRLCKLFFAKHLDWVMRLSYLQAAIFLGIGLQHKRIEGISKDLGDLQASQILPLLNKSVKKFTGVFRKIYEDEATKHISQFKPNKATEILENATAVKESLTKDLDAEGKKLLQDLQKQKEDFKKAAKDKKTNMRKRDKKFKHKNKNLN